MFEKIDKIVRKETLYIAAWVVILSVLMEAIFIIAGKWSWMVFFGNLWSATLSVLNFFIMGIGVQKALAKQEEKAAKQIIKLSHTLRSLALVALSVLGAVLFNIWAVVIPLLFPRIGMLFRSKFDYDE